MIIAVDFDEFEKFGGNGVGEEFVKKGKIMLLKNNEAENA